MGLLLEARDVTFHLNRFVGSGSGAITDKAFHEAYQQYRNDKQKLKIKDIDLFQATAIVEKAKKFGFIDLNRHDGVQDYFITDKGYELIETFWNLNTGVVKLYLKRSPYVPIVISIIALIVAVYAALKGK